MTDSNMQKEDRSNAWKSWYSTLEIEVDEDMPMLDEIFKKHGVSKILDLGCGTGRHTVYFADAGYEVYGFDFSRYAIKRAREILKENQLHANLKVWDMTNPFPYEDEFFGAVISISAFHHHKVENIKKVIAEIDRVTGKGSYLYVKVPRLERMLERIKQGDKLNEIAPGTFVILEGTQKGVPHHVFSKEELIRLFHSFNVESITSRNYSYSFLAGKS